MAVTNPYQKDWQHTKECTDKLCFCTDPQDPDPVCECGNPGYACICSEKDEEYEDIRVNMWENNCNPRGSQY